MFFVLGFAPFYVLARVLKAAGILRVPRKVELAGLDTNTLAPSYPYFSGTYTAFEEIEKREGLKELSTSDKPT